MTTKFKHLSLCLLLIGLNACSSKDKHESNPAVEHQTEEKTVGSETASEKSTVIVPKEKLSADQSWAEIESQVLQTHYSLLYPTMWESQYFELSSFSDNYELIHSQLNLSKDQIFVTGNRDHDPEDNRLFLDLSNDEYFKYANNLAINHIRLMKVPQIAPKQEFEKSDAYAQRVQQAQQKTEKKVIDYDLELLQQALNRSVLDISFRNPYASYEYDADQEQMLIRFEQPLRNMEIIESELWLKVQPSLAKTLAENFTELRLGYVLNMRNNQLHLNGVFFYLKDFGNPDQQSNVMQETMYVSPVFKPISFKLRSGSRDEASEQFKTMPFQDVMSTSAWNFKFGLDNYLSPETVLKKYPKPQAQPPEESDFKVPKEMGGL